MHGFFYMWSSRPSGGKQVCGMINLRFFRSTAKLMKISSMQNFHVLQYPMVLYTKKWNFFKSRVGTFFKFVSLVSCLVALR